jgi:hypothetical protein
LWGLIILNLFKKKNLSWVVVVKWMQGLQKISGIDFFSFGWGNSVIY